jgi:UDP-N-acetylmuramoyl-L-alanyl-D-glutamate--2,6-diaminopimelate ligase
MTGRSVPITFSPQPLATLVDRLRRAGLLVSADDEGEGTVDHLAFDSRAIGPGGLFVAIRGEHTDGHLFIDKAVQNGATAIACEATPAGDWPAGVARVRVSDSPRALAELACAAFGDPSRALRTIGVTGTNGKTTTAWLCAQGLDGVGLPCGYLGTLGSGRVHRMTPGSHTTPDAVSLQAFLRGLADDACAAAALEVSSHALVQRRTHGIRFEVGVFTNLTRDHLDYHSDFESYASAKRLLFQSMTADSTAVVNADDPAAASVVAGTPPRQVRFGTGTDADVRYAILGDGIGGLRLHLDGHDRRFRLSGAFNASNLAAAYATLVALGVDGSEAAESLAGAAPAPGRFEPVAAPGCADFLVDYAHTPDALVHALAAARELVGPDGRLWCVFGCGGDRDAGKRPQMGAVAEAGADRVVVTSDNPRTEDPERILEDVRSGVSRPEDMLWIVDRREAIHAAARLADESDVVLVAGKGHETYQVVGEERLPFDDRDVILEACNQVA